MKAKERSYLKGQASTIEDVIFIGKDNISDNIIRETENALKARELIKGKVQQNSSISPREAGEYLSEQTGSILIGTIGSKFILYKRNKDIDRYKIEE